MTDVEAADAAPAPRTWGSPATTGDEDRDARWAQALTDTAQMGRKTTPSQKGRLDHSVDPTDARLMRVMRENGVVFPFQTLFACKWVHAQLAVCCANLDMESAGGENIFGGDPGGNALPRSWFETAVTRPKYEVYSHNVDVLHMRVNGVGPTQLTSRGLQLDADRRGGCWLPEHNMATGFLFLANLIARAGSQWDGFRDYNGSGPAAEAYANHAVTLIEAWARRF